MKLLFDASALINLIRLAGPDALNYLKDSYVLTLTPYEVGNALWREAALLRRITVEEALSTLASIAAVYKFLRITTPRDTLLVLRLAHELRVTYYDSSYIAASHELGAELVTDDEKLRRRIREERGRLSRILGSEVAALSTRELVRE